MKYSTIVSHLGREYEKALNSKYVKKPMSYALYHTWKWCDTYEKERKSKEKKQ